MGITWVEPVQFHTKELTYQDILKGCASRLVCPAIVSISCTTSPMRWAVLLRPSTVELVLSASTTASLAILDDCSTCRPISSTEEDSSSAEDATVCTLADASSTEAATAVA